MKKKIVFVCLCCICVMFASAQELERKVQEAVSGLTVQLGTRLDVSIGLMTLDGTTDAVSAFSRQLSMLVYEHAGKVPLFRVVNVPRGDMRRPDAPSKGIIKGIFAKRNNLVEVFLYLVSEPGGVNLSPPQRFTFPLAELTERGITIEPENITVVQKQEQTFEELSGSKTPKPSSATPANQSIKIQAFFNSESMTYFHRDELKMSVMADRDCYFKIIHIDANNQMKMIYPNNSGDRDNRLRANVPRDIFETAKYYLYDPYGAETILVVASLQQFENIEREYIAPWVLPATTDNIRAAVSTGRGGDMEAVITFSGEGEARYTITILKPDTQYSYSRPENMREFFQSTRTEIERQGGTFVDGNESSGCYIIDGIRASYRVPRNAPDTIQFATYNLDNYTSVSRPRGQTRGGEFNFNFQRPGNITQAIQMVRSGIEGSGGTFTGNERQGNFQAKGITGRYQVTDVVTVTITEKPVVIPNSLIEREVKSYFTGR